MTTVARAHPKLDAIILAGGAGRRFGGGKLLAPWGSGLLIEATLDAAFAAPARTVLVVTGADAGVMPVCLEYALSEGEAARLRFVHAEDHAEGMGASLRAGVRALPADSDGVFVFLGDMPRIPTDLATRLAEALTQGAPAAAPVHNGQRGHPVLFGAGLYPSLRQATGDEGARAALKRLGDRLALIPTQDPGVLFDIDTADQIPPGV